MVIRAGILVSCANILKQKGMSSLGPEGLFRTRSNWTSFCFSFPGGGTEAKTGISIDVFGCCVSSVVFSYCLRYDFSDWVPVGLGYSIVCCESMLLIFRITERSYCYIVIIWQNRDNIAGSPLDLDSFEPHCTSWARSGCTHMTFPVFNVKGTRLLVSCCFAEGWFISSYALGNGKDPSGTVTFDLVPNSRVTIFAVTFFCSDFKVKTPTLTKAWILCWPEGPSL